MAVSVESTLRRIRNQAVLLSWALEVAENSHDPPVHALEGLSDICDEMEDLVERLKATLEDIPKVLNAAMVEWEDDDEGENGEE